MGFPKGCKQTARVRVYHLEHQIFPTNPDEPASWDGDIEGGQMHYKLDAPPYLLKARGDSPNATKPHNVPVFINILPQNIAEPYQDQQSLISRVLNLLGVK